MNILVTGGSGFIGNELIKRLSVNHRVRVLDLIECRIGGVEVTVGSILDRKVVRTALTNMEVVFHLAGQINEGFSRHNPQEDLEINGLGTLNVLEGCGENHLNRIIFASTAAVYGVPKKDLVDESHETRPVTPYGCSKLCAETYIKAYSTMYGLDYTILRFFNIYGLNGKGVANIFYNKAVKNEDLQISGDGSQYRDFVYVDDAISAYCASLNDNSRNQTFNIGSGERVTIKELAQEVIQITNSNSKVNFVPTKDVSMKYPVADIERARKLIDFNPKYSIKEGLKLMHLIGGLK
jgi:UDP-glucose 4-epimerase